MSTQRVFVVHGYTADSEQHWFPWLRAQLESPSTVVSVLDMPNSSAPEPELWLSTLAEAVGAVDADTVLIGHSLGCITILRYLDSLSSDQRLGTAILVSGFAESLGNLPALDSFVSDPIDLSALRNRIDRVEVIASDNDSIVAPSATHRLAASLGVPVTVIAGAGHFLGREGHTEVPELLRVVTAAA
jgi:predicted alpha/beta hydrolase family esterase